MNKKAIIIPIFSLVALVGGFFAQKYLVTDQNVQLNRSEILEMAQILSREWNTPSWNRQEVEQNCPELKEYFSHASEEMFRCRPEYLACRLKNLKSDIQISSYKPIFRVIQKSQHIPHFALRVNLTSKKGNRSILLEDECHRIYLPERRYRYSHSDKNEKWYWDNFNRHIYIDRFMVSNSDIWHWKMAKGDQSVKKPNVLLPETELNREQMKSFCFDRGGHLIQAHIYDAAAIMPKSIDDSRPEAISLSPFPWSPLAISDPLYRMQEKKEKFSQAVACKRINAKECTDLHPHFYASNEFETWSGMGDVMNGIAEYVDNPIEPKSNIYLFDSQFSALSKFFRLGNRGFWNGSGNLRENFEFEGDDDIDTWPLKVGFRCMYYVEEKK